MLTHTLSYKQAHTFAQATLHSHALLERAAAEAQRIQAEEAAAAKAEQQLPPKAPEPASGALI